MQTKKLQKNGILYILTILLLQSCGINVNKENTKPAIITFKQYQKVIKNTNKTLLVNFWATWCKPCVEELPYFEAMQKKYADENFQVLLVSLDFLEEYETKFLPYFKDNQIVSTMYLLNYSKSNGWIDQVNPQWSGALPATIIYSNEGKMNYFNEGELSLQQLENLVNKFK